MIERTPLSADNPLETAVFTNDGKNTYMHETPYGNWKKGTEGWAKGILDRKDEIDESGNENERIELAYAEHRKKAFEDEKAGNPREAMRLLIGAFENETPDPNMDYSVAMTPQEARAAFMKMGEKVFKYDSIIARSQLARQWEVSTPFGSPEIFKAYDFRSKNFLTELDHSIYSLKAISRDPLAHTSAGEDMKLLWTMMKMQEDLNQRIYGRADITIDEKRQIEEQREKLG